MKTMDTKTYFITLTPRQLFFFGGEQGKPADYFVKGSFLPQQTALLGLVRHQVLLQNSLMHNNKIINDIEAAKWIGEKSFEYHNEDNEFGKVISISQCFLVGKDENSKSTKYLPYHQPYCSKLIRLNDVFFLPDYDPKNNYIDMWKSLDKKKSVCNHDNVIYEEVIKPGVDKNYTGKTEEDDNAYYKQVWLKMKKGFSFGFYATIGKDVIFSSAEASFGKENAPFIMNVSEAENIEVFSDDEEPNALMLTSDAFVQVDILNPSAFAVTDTIHFRNIINTTSQNTPYYTFDNRLSKKNLMRLQLYKRGSVFFAKDRMLEAIKNEIDRHRNFKNIGYNHFHLLNISY